MDSWEKDGKKETKIYVKAQDVRFSNVGGKSESTESENKTPKQQVKQAPKQSSKQEDDDFADVPF